MSKMRTWFRCCVCSFFTMAATVLFMPIAAKAEQRITTMVVGSVFWLMLIGGYVFLILASRARKQYLSRQTSKAPLTTDRIGLLSFFSNPPAIFADALLALSAVLLAVFSFTKLNTSYGMYVFVFFFIFSFHGHALFNGRIYKTINFSKSEESETNVS